MDIATKMKLTNQQLQFITGFVLGIVSLHCKAKSFKPKVDKGRPGYTQP